MKYLLIMVVFFALISCNNKKNLNYQKQDFDTIEMEYAKWFKIIKNENSKYVIIENPWESNTVFAKYNLDSVKINDFALLSVSDIGYFNQLDVLNKISGMADFHLIYNPILQKRISDNNIFNLGQSASINLESLLSLKPDAFVEPAFQNKNNSNDIIEKSDILVIYNLDWFEEHPLGRAEWIKFFAQFTNQTDLADSIFNMVKKRYNALSAKVYDYQNKPDVLIGTNYKGVWYMPSGDSFKAKLLADAGVNYKWKNVSNSGSLALNFENVLKEQNNAEFWIDIPFENKSQLSEMDARYKLFKAYKNSNLFNNLKRSEKSGANDYWEYAFVRPDILLNDLINIFHNDSINNNDLFFYQRLKDE